MRYLLIAMLACLVPVLTPQCVAANEKPAKVAGGEAAPVSPPILSREKWQAKPPIAGMNSQHAVGIIIHHTGSRKNFAITLENKMRNLQSFSQHPGKVSPTYVKSAWPDVPYHFYVDAGGQIAEGRDIRFAGDTNTGYDTSGYIQVVVEGDFDKETLDQAQLSSLRELLVWLSLSWDIPVDAISVHKDHASTTCPGRNFMAILPALRAQITEQRHKLVEEYCRNAPGSTELTCVRVE